MLRSGNAFIRRFVRYIPSVGTTAVDAVQETMRLESVAHDQRATAEMEKFQTDWTERWDRQQTALSSNLLRIGGGRVLKSANNAVMAQPETHALFFSAVSPRDAGLCQTLCAQLRQLRIHRLTELQGALVPLMLKGKHVIGHAETGSGKSFGIALATCNRIARQNITYRLHTLILVPTDLLALQYERWFHHFNGHTRHSVLAAVHELPLEHLLAQLHNVHPHVLVGTPQRIAELARYAPSVLGEALRKKVDTIVLDEADVLLRTPIDDPIRTDRTLAVARGAPKRKLQSCADLVDLLYRNSPSELPAQIVATSATVDSATLAKLNAWMRDDDCARLTTSVVEHALPQGLRFSFLTAASPDGPNDFAPLVKLLRLLFLQHGAPNSGDISSGGGRHHQQPGGDDQVASNTHYKPFRTPKVLIFVDETNVDLAAMEDALQMEIASSREAAAAASATYLAPDAPKRPKARDLLKCALADASAVALSGGTEADVDGGVSTSGSGTPGTQPPQVPGAVFVAHQRKYHRRIIGRNGEIFCFNDSSVSLLDTGRCNIGFAPYGLARGLHVRGVTHVVIWGGMPSTTDFVHCAGRAGRRGVEGSVIVAAPPVSCRMAQDVWSALGLEWGVSGAVGAAPTPLLQNEGDLVDVALQKTLREYDCDPLPESVASSSSSGDHENANAAASLPAMDPAVDASDLFEELSA